MLSSIANVKNIPRETDLTHISFCCEFQDTKIHHISMHFIE